MRYILIDRLTELVPRERAVATKTFSGDEDFFRDHFPGFPVVPGALLVEGMSQTAGWLIAASVEFSKWPLLSMVHAAKFRRFAAAREELRFEAAVESMESESCTARASVTRDGSRLAEATLAFRMFEPGSLGDGSEAFADWSRETFAMLQRGDR